MTKKPIYRTSLLITIFMFMGFSTLAQDTYIKGRWNFKLTGAPEYYVKDKGTRQAFLMAEANYGFFNHIEAGIALGFENNRVVKLKPTASNPPGLTDYYSEPYKSPLYNFHINYHFLPYLVGERNPRFDVYLTGKLGGAYLESDFSDQKFFWNYYLGAGFGWYFTKHIGIYSEYGKQSPLKGESNKKAGFRFGLALKF